MRKFLISAIIGLLILIFLIIHFGYKLNGEVDLFSYFIFKQLEREDEIRRNKIENGEIVAGKDTALIWGNIYEIWNQSGDYRLSIETKNLTRNILEKIQNYKKIDNCLYIVSEEGFAVIDENNLCRAYVTVPETEFVNGYSIDSEGNKVYYSRFIEDDNIQYLDDYDDFTDDEKNVFDILN